MDRRFLTQSLLAPEAPSMAMLYMMNATLTYGVYDNAGWKKIQYRNTVKDGKIVEVSLSYNLSPKRPLKCSDSKYFFQVMSITDPNDGKLSEIFHFLLIGFCFYRFPGGPQLVIEQLEQIRNLSAATDNSITSDQKIEAREKSDNFL